MLKPLLLASGVIALMATPVEAKHRHHRHHYYSYGYNSHWPWGVAYPAYGYNYGYPGYWYRSSGYRNYGYWPRYYRYRDDDRRYYRDSWRHRGNWDDQGEDNDDQ